MAERFLCIRGMISFYSKLIIVLSGVLFFTVGVKIVPTIVIANKLLFKEREMVYFTPDYIITQKLHPV